MIRSDDAFSDLDEALTHLPLSKVVRRFLSQVGLVNKLEVEIA